MYWTKQLNGDIETATKTIQRCSNYIKRTLSTLFANINHLNNNNNISSSSGKNKEIKSFEVKNRNSFEESNLQSPIIK